jgi:hypothetical protein
MVVLACLSVRFASGWSTRRRIRIRDLTHGHRVAPGSKVRFAAQGPQAANGVGISNEADLFHTMARALGLEYRRTGGAIGYWRTDRTRR